MFQSEFLAQNKARFARNQRKQKLNRALYVLLNFVAVILSGTMFMTGGMILALLDNMLLVHSNYVTFPLFLLKGSLWTIVITSLLLVIYFTLRTLDEAFLERSDPRRITGKSR